MRPFAAKFRVPEASVGGTKLAGCPGMARIGRLPSVPDELMSDVLSTSWSIANTNRDPKLVVRATPGEFVTGCPSCHAKLVIDVLGIPADDAKQTSTLRSLIRHVTSVAAHTPLTNAAELLSSSTRRLLAVVDTEHRPIGVLASTHVIAAVKYRNRDALVRVTCLEASSEAILLPATTTIKMAANAFVRNEWEFVLVVDDGGRLLGAVLAADLLTALT
jgi:predicted transcriptional regulator